MAPLSYLRKKPRRRKDGSLQAYWYRCETHWEDGRSHERVIEYLGTNPNVRNFALDPPLARKVAALVAESISPTEAMTKLTDLGLEVPFRPRQLQFLNTPPLRRLALRVE
ncbi:hypothetical protein B1B_00976 [mine drainage metagenome]|uniref:Uncharacterized protein n=1 Tax=mine drainage metagenome TaxID=410659 RepID=T1C973_9ZZZZ